MNLVESLYSDRMSMVALSNLLTKSFASKKDERQEVPTSPCIPPVPTRQLLADLVVEEAVELLQALGFSIVVPGWGEKPRAVMHSWVANDPQNPQNLANIIDQSCDLQYVTSGVLVACGMADLPHLAEVCECNEAKFPDGVPICHPVTGKYLKPEGWTPPNHEECLKRTPFNMRQVGDLLMSQYYANKADDGGGKEYIKKSHEDPAVAE
jgi:predicted HAD superfamily Cof-like phosphohydrolase